MTSQVQLRQDDPLAPRRASGAVHVDRGEPSDIHDGMFSHRNVFTPKHAFGSRRRGGTGPWPAPPRQHRPEVARATHRRTCSQEFSGYLPGIKRACLALCLNEGTLSSSAECPAPTAERCTTEE